MKNLLGQQKLDLLMKVPPFASENTDMIGIYREYLLLGFYLFIAMVAAFIINLLFELSKK